MITVKRTAIWHALREIEIEKPILLPYSQEELQELFFDQKIDNEGNVYYRLNDIIEKVLSKIDCSNVCFDNVKMEGLKLSNAYNIRFNPQNIYKRNLNNTVLGENIVIIGNDNANQRDLFEGVDIKGTIFYHCKNVRINPQTVKEKDFSHTSLEGIDFTGFSFDGTQLWCTNFKGSIGVKINPNKVWNFEHVESLSDVELTDIPEDDMYAKATGAKNYFELMTKLEQSQTEFIELIKDQLPEEKKEEPKPEIEPEQPKQKRKWFGN